MSRAVMLPDPSLPPRELGILHRASVLSAPGAPMLAGAVALAAGRFQPLVRLPVASTSREGAGPTGRFQDPPISVSATCWPWCSRRGISPAALNRVCCLGASVDTISLATIVIS